MPYHIEHDHSECSGHAVIKDDDGKLMGCHETMVEAEAQMAALYAAMEKRNKAVRKLIDGESYSASAFLVIEDEEKPSTWHLRIRDAKGALDHRLMGAAWAALHGGYRGNQYEGPDKQIAIATLRKLYEQEELPIPGEGKSITKIGSRNSAMDMERIQAIHDRTVELGAMCQPKPDMMEMSLFPEMPEMKAIKMLGNNRLGGYAVLWGSDSERDLDGEYFDAETAEMTSIFKAVGRLPYLYNHASDNTIKSSVVGVVDVLAPDDVGIWYETQLDMANQYVGAIRKLVGRKALGTSSGTLPNARRVEKSGRIARWPIAELSATPSPADFRQRLERPLIEMKSIFQAIGLELNISADSVSAVEAATPEVEKSTASVASEAAKAKRLMLELELLRI